MKKGIVALLLSVCILTPVYAEDNSERIAEIESRIEELNQELADLNAELKTLKNDGGFTYEAEGHSYTYLKHEVTEHNGEDYVVFYFDYTNNSGETAYCDSVVSTEVFQDGVQLTGYSWIGNEAMENKMKKVQSGASLEIAQGYKLTSKNDITFYIGNRYDFNPEEYTFSLE